QDILASSPLKSLASLSKELPTVPISAVHQSAKMQGLIRGLRSCQETVKLSILKNSLGRISIEGKNMFSRFGCVTSSPSPLGTQEKGLENMTVADVLMTKGEEKVGSWLWCRINDNVDDAMKNVGINQQSFQKLKWTPVFHQVVDMVWRLFTKRNKEILQMAEHNIGSLLVLKPGEQQHIAGIITERDYLRKIIGQGRSPKYTRVGEIMTKENKLITVTSDTSILQAMQLMTDNHIRHVPVIDGKIVGMVSIVDVVRAVVEQQEGELKRLNEFIRGEYY
ncbi:CBS domain - like 10, partial [Theobroma cacao]